jgi:hypothetical protein
MNKYKHLESKLKSVGVIHYKKACTFLYTANNYYYVNIYKPNMNNINQTDYSQTGGSHINYIYEGIKFKIFVNNDEDLIYLNINVDNDENKEQCIFVQIDKTIHTANIQNISFYKNCITNRFKTQKSGSFLLNMIISFLKSKRTEYDINKIQIQDNALKFCKEKKDNIHLSLLSTLTGGHTWYGKYGFVPFNNTTFMMNRALCKIYMTNIQIMDTTLVKDTNVEKYVRKALKKEDMEGMIEDIDGLFKFYNNKLLKTFLFQFMKEFDKTCVLFFRFYIKLAEDIQLYDFHRVSFYLPI